MIRVLLVDDKPTVRKGLRMSLALEPDIDVVGEAADGREAVTQTRLLLPDVVLMDLSMPVMDGLDATQALQDAAPQSTVVILSLHDTLDNRRRARQAGAADFVAKHEGNQVLVDAIRRAAGRR